MDACKGEPAAPLLAVVSRRPFVSSFGPALVASWPDSLLDGSEMGRRIREFDWGATPLGPIDAWPQSLRSYASMIVGTNFQSYIFWGTHFYSLYNDAFIPIAGTKHPHSLGRPVIDDWREVYDTLGPLLDGVRETGTAATFSDQPFGIMRRGFQEEFYCTIVYSALRDETGAVGGVLATLNETTATVLAQRRIETLRDLAARSAEAMTERETYTKICDALAASADLPFALLYVVDAATGIARLEASVGMRAGDEVAPRAVEPGDASPWPIGEALASGRPAFVAPTHPALRGLRDERWNEALRGVLVVPLRAANRPGSFGVLVAGLGSRLYFDAAYREFIVLASGQIANMIVGARAYEAERSRAEALAEIDRSKTAFFSNVSHEFRTPLTLMLGPLEGLLAKSSDLRDDVRETLSLVHRNAARLQKLVNSLLEFSRVEAGRREARYVETDLTALTAGLASQFRPLVEAAGMRFSIDVALPGPRTFVDRAMWETIVLNLVSNAYKFTFEGEIAIALTDDGTSSELSVRDTGAGISATDLPRIFERFHRIEGARSRTHEGSGIGLALVAGLVKALGGTIRVESEPARGSTFFVSVPNRRTGGNALGHVTGDHAPEHDAAADVAETRAASYVDEASQWVTPATRVVAAQANGSRSATAKPCIVLADDNADMREYVTGLLEAHYDVIAVADGAAALAAVNDAAVDLVLSDVMMPVLDGFGLLRAIRADPALRTIPVVLLSARAGEEAAIEGLEDGADDYVVKPFGARELLARVHANITLARLRHDYEDQHQVANLFQHASLPKLLPTIPGLSFDAVYGPANNDSLVGGDWYDAVRLLDGRVVISIGDVAGSGIAAAVTMGNMRQIIRGIAQVHADPVLMLNAADRALRLEHPDLFVTAFVGVVDTITRTLSYASAGHPPPYVRFPDGALEMLMQTGLPLGLRYGHSETTVRSIELPDDALLVLYTDGLTESTRDVVEGDRRLEAALHDDLIALAERPAAALHRAMLGGRPTSDDVAILTVRIGDAGALAPDGDAPLVQRWSFHASDGVEAQAARRKIGELLRARGASSEDVYDAELVFGELIGNIVRYAPGRAEVNLDWSGVLPVLHVMDNGPGFRHIALLPSDLYSESGRGLFLVSTLTEDFRVSKRLAGGSHACAVLSLGRNRLASVSHTASGGLFLDALLPST